VPTTGEVSSWTCPAPSPAALRLLVQPLPPSPLLPSKEESTGSAPTPPSVRANDLEQQRFTHFIEQAAPVTASPAAQQREGARSHTLVGESCPRLRLLILCA